MAALDNTMSGNTITPPVTPDSNKQADTAITDAYAKLNSILNGMPGIDYQKKFQPMIDEAKNRPVSKMPNPLAAAAAVFGSPQNAPKILQSRWEQMHAEQGAKDRDLLSLQHAIAQGELSQEVEKGNFKKAMAQSEVLAKLKHTLDKLDREDLMKEWQQKNKELFGGRMALQNLKGSQAAALLKDKIAGVASNFNLDAKMQLVLAKEAMRLMSLPFALYGGRQDLITGDFNLDPVDFDTRLEAALPSIVEKARQLAQSAPKVGGTSSTSDGGEQTPEQKALAAIRAKAKK